MSSSNDDSIWAQTAQAVATSWPRPRWCDVGVVVACSGGADSVALVRVLAELHEQHQDSRGTLAIAHFNHGLRGQEADGDQEFVRRLAGQLSLRLLTSRGTGEHQDESTLRQERLRFLVGIAQTLGARYVALGHTADDNVETMLHHLMRGSGPSGLAAMPPARPLGDDLVLVRPLLSLRREVLRSGLRCIGQTWREDSSNTNLDYRRNWIRAELMPLMESGYPQAASAIVRAIEGQQQWRRVIDRLAEQWLEEHWQATSPVSLTVDARAERAIIISALQILWDRQSWPRQSMSFQHWSAVADLVTEAADEAINLPGDVVARLDGGLVVLTF